MYGMRGWEGRIRGQEVLVFFKALVYVFFRSYQWGIYLYTYILFIYIYIYIFIYGWSSVLSIHQLWHLLHFILPPTPPTHPYIRSSAFIKYAYEVQDYVIIDGKQLIIIGKEHFTPKMKYNF